MKGHTHLVIKISIYCCKLHRIFYSMLSWQIEEMHIDGYSNKPLTGDNLPNDVVIDLCNHLEAKIRNLTINCLYWHCITNLTLPILLITIFIIWTRELKYICLSSIESKTFFFNIWIIVFQGSSQSLWSSKCSGCTGQSNLLQTVWLHRHTGQPSFTIPILTELYRCAGYCRLW